MDTRLPRLRTRSSCSVGLAAIAATCLLALGCAGMGGTAETPTVPWSQTLVTQAAQTLMQQFGGLYDSALKQPAFAGERSANLELLDKLRILKEESDGLHAKLANGMGREETTDNWLRIKEVSRDAREAESWDFLPTDFADHAKAVLATTDTLDGFYGTQQ
jgi:hypothetical protein